MLTQLSTIKSRLALTDATHDALLTSAIKSVSARFDNECNRTFPRTENAVFEFDPADSEICTPLYPIESVTKFELKSSESEGWQEQANIDYLIRRACIISLNFQFSVSNFQFSIGRLTLTGGYVLPGTTPAPGQTPLPDDLEQAAVEQVAEWFQNREHLGLKTSWPSSGEYKQFSQLPLLPSVRATLDHYRRWTL